MLKSDLAEELRERQRLSGYISLVKINSLSDDEIIDSYITCSCCGEKQVDGSGLQTAIFMAKNSESFFNICDQMAYTMGKSRHDDKR